MSAVAQSFIGEVEAREAELGNHFVSEQAIPQLPAFANTAVFRAVCLAIGLASMVGYVLADTIFPWRIVSFVAAVIGLVASVYRLRARSPKLAAWVAHGLTFGPPWFTVLVAITVVGLFGVASAHRGPEAWQAFEMIMLMMLTTVRTLIAEKNLGRGALRGYRVRLAMFLHIVSIVLCCLLVSSLAATIAKGMGTTVPLSIKAAIITTGLASVAATVRRPRKVMAAAVCAIDSLRCELAAMRADQHRERELGKAALDLERALSAGVDVPWRWCKAPVETGDYRDQLMGALSSITGYELTDGKRRLVARDPAQVHRRNDRRVSPDRLTDELLRLRAQVSRHADVVA